MGQEGWYMNVQRTPCGERSACRSWKGERNMKKGTGIHNATTVTIADIYTRELLERRPANSSPSPCRVDHAYLEGELFVQVPQLEVDPWMCQCQFPRRRSEDVCSWDCWRLDVKYCTIQLFSQTFFVSLWKRGKNRSVIWHGKPRTGLRRLVVHQAYKRVFR